MQVSNARILTSFDSLVVLGALLRAEENGLACLNVTLFCNIGFIFFRNKKLDLT